MLAALAARGITHFTETNEPGDEARLAAHAIRNGAATIVAIGGDGTCSRIAGAIVEAESTCRLAVVPFGTGNDFAKTVGVLGLSTLQIAELVVTGASAQIDLGSIDGTYFLNSCGFGFDAAVLEASQDLRLFRGDTVYILSALRQLFGYDGIDVSPESAAGAPGGRMLMVTASNGRSLGGAFTIAPHASVVDGKLDLCFITDATIINRVRLFLAVMRGTHLTMPGVRAVAVARSTLSFASPPMMEVDGELLRARGKTVELRCIPKALSVIAAPGAVAVRRDLRAEV